MLNFFTNRRRRLKALQLLASIYESLKEILPNIFENSLHWKTASVSIHENQIEFLNISYDQTYIDKNRKRNNRDYNLRNIKVESKRSRNFYLVDVKVEFNIIKSIKINTKYLLDEIDTSKVDISEIIVEEIIYPNNDKQTLLDIIGNSDVLNLTSIELDDTFEIELEGKLFYKIVDLEDGNYIAVNKKGQVFRLNHDSDKPAKKIYNSYDDFVTSYSGRKIELQHFFDD